MWQSILQMEIIIQFELNLNKTLGDLNEMKHFQLAL